MSHFTRLRTTLRDGDLLTTALQQVGYAHVELHATPQTLYGYQGDRRPERAEVVVRREHVGPYSNDIGFARQADGSFEAIISDYDRRQHDERWLSRVTQAYGHAAALRYADSHGFEVLTDEVEQDGTRRLTLRRVG